MKIRTVVVETNSRVGDNWRQRYPTLALHTPRAHVSSACLSTLRMLSHCFSLRCSSALSTVPQELAHLYTTRQTGELARTVLSLHYSYAPVQYPCIQPFGWGTCGWWPGTRFQYPWHSFCSARLPMFPHCLTIMKTLMIGVIPLNI